MKKVLIAFCILLLACALALFACGDDCAHSYGGDCDADCNECGETREVTAEHNYYGDCDASCHSCGMKREVTEEHRWTTVLNDDCCNELEACEGCGAVKGDYVKHIWASADCETPKSCTTCGKTEGDALGHSYTLRGCDDYEHEEVCALCETPKAGSREAHALNGEYACECGFSLNATETEITEDEKLVRLYNASGVLIKESWLYADGSSRVTDYDANGKTVRESLISTDGSSYVIDYEYGENGLKTKVTQKIFQPDGSCTGVLVVTYNEKENATEELQYEYLEDGSVYTVRKLFEYDENDMLIADYQYDDGALTWTQLYFYSDTGALAKEIHKDNLDEVRRTVFYEHYEDGTNKSMIQYYGDSDALEAEILYYPNGFTQSEKYYYEDGTLNREYSYDEEGNLIFEKQYE